MKLVYYYPLLQILSGLLSITIIYLLNEYVESVNSFRIRKYVDSIIWKRYQRLNNAGTTTISVKPPVTMTQHLAKTASQRKKKTFLSHGIRNISSWPLGSVLEPEVKKSTMVLGECSRSCPSYGRQGA